jgi:hypothetical protein
MAKNTQEVVVFIILLAIAVPIGAWLHDCTFEQRYGYKMYRKRKKY